MSEASERFRDERVLEGVLAAVDDPAVVCDSTGSVRAWNEAFDARTATDATIDGAAVGQFLEWDDGNPLARALDGEAATASARLAGDGRRYSVTARPLGEGAGAVVTVSDVDPDWPVYEAALDASPDNVYVFDADLRIRTVSDGFERATGVSLEAVRGEPIDCLAEYGVLTEHAVERGREALRAVVDGRRDEVTMTTEPVVDPGTVTESRLAPIRYEGAVVGAVVVVRDVTDRERALEAHRRSQERLRTILESLPVSMFATDADGRIDHVQGFEFGAVPCDRSDLVGAPVDVLADTAGNFVEACRRALEGDPVSTTVTVGDSSYEAAVEPVREGGEVTGTIAVAMDVTELQRQREELETLTAIQELVQESVRGATNASTREAIKRTVCDRLADSPFYEGAWIGSRTPPTRSITPDYAPDDLSEYLEAVSVTVDTSEQGQGPGGTAYRTGEVQVVEDVREDPDFEPWREAALERGFESLAVVPLTHGSTTHGILVVYTDRPDPFSDRETEGFETLGAAVGFALSAAQHRRLLEADRVLELEYVIESDRSSFIRASAEHDCRFVVSDPVRASDGEVLNYLTVEGADPAVGARAAREYDGLVSLRRLDGSGPHFEVKWRGSVFQYLTEAGARGVRGVIEDGVGRLHVEAPGDIDVRRVTEAVRRRFDAVALAAKRERDRPDTPWWHAHGDVGTQLTDRQRSVLRSAYYSGYYEWPRETDAETLADSLDVATPTLLQHLRKGHRRVLETVFDS